MSLLGFLGKVATGFVTGGPAGAVLAGASDIAGSLAGKPRPTALPAGGAPTGSLVTTLRNQVLQARPPALTPSINVARAGFAADPGKQTQIGLVNIGAPPPLAPQGPGMPAGWHPPMALPGTAQQGCAKGYHMNRAGYYRKGGPRSKYNAGWVEKGTVCVKNRRRNPLNPRALSRSMARLSSAKNAAKALNRFSIRPRCPTR